MTTPYRTLGQDQVYVDRVSVATRSYRDVVYTEDHDLATGATLALCNALKNGTTRWETLLEDGQGPPSAFIQALQLDGNVTCHKMDDAACKYLWVLRKLSTGPRHRIDTLPENVSLGELVMDLAALQTAYAVVFNIGSQPRLLSGELFNMDNLRWLNMGGPHVTGLHFHKLVQALNLGKLRALEGVVLSGARIKKHNLISDVGALKRGKLKYLETDHVIQAEGFTLLECEAGFRMLGDAAKLVHLETKNVLSTHTGTLLDYAVAKDWYERGGPPLITDFHAYKISKVQPGCLENGGRTMSATNSRVVARTKAFVKKRKSTFFTLGKK